MQNGLLRVLKFQSINYLVSIPTYITMSIFFYFYAGFLDNFVTFEGMIIGAVIIMPLAFQAANSGIYFKQMIGFSLTRKNEFISSLINKIYYCSLGVLFCYGLTIYNENLQLNNILSLAFIFIFSFLLAAFADFIVLTFLKFTQLNFIFLRFILFTVLSGVTIGLIIAVLNKFDILAFAINWNTVIISFLLTLVLLYINWNWVNKLEIRFQK